jgi:transcriptional regulator with XRE-family HTH domain
MAIMISSNLRMLRSNSNYSLENVAEIVGVSRQTIAKWESGETYPDIENCVKLSALFKVSLDAFVKEPIQLMDNEPNDKGQYMFGIVKVAENGAIPLPEKAKQLMNIMPGDRMLLLGDKRQGIAVVKCDGINDYIDMEERQ